MTNPAAAKGVGARNGRTPSIVDIKQAALAGENADSGMQDRIAMVDQATPVAEGSGGPTLIAILQATVKGTGRFRWSAGLSHAGVAGDTVTAAVNVQNDGTAGAPTYTNATDVPSNQGITPPTNSGNKIVGPAGAGTGIAFGAGFGGGPVQLAHDVKVIGTAASGYSWSSSGDLYDFANGTGFPVGRHVYLVLVITNNTANRNCTGIAMSLEEEAA